MTVDNYEKQSVKLEQKLKDFGVNEQVLYKIRKLFAQEEQEFREALEESKGLVFYNPEKTEERVKDFARTLRDQHLRVLGAVYSSYKFGEGLETSLEEKGVEKSIKDCLVKMI